MMFLLHTWDSVLDYKDESMREAIICETTFNVLLFGDLTIVPD